MFGVSKLWDAELRRGLSDKTTLVPESLVRKRTFDHVNDLLRSLRLSSAQISKRLHVGTMTACNRSQGLLGLDGREPPREVVIPHANLYQYSLNDFCALLSDLPLKNLDLLFDFQGLIQDGNDFSIDSWWLKPSLDVWKQKGSLSLQLGFLMGCYSNWSDRTTPEAKGLMESLVESLRAAGIKVLCNNLCLTNRIQRWHCMKEDFAAATI